MTRKTTAALAFMFCSWTLESQAGFMPPLFSGMSPFDGKSLGFSLPEKDRKLCISPCFSMGTGGYIAEYIFVARNDLADFSPRFFPGLLPEGFIYPVQSPKDISQHKNKHEDKHEDKNKDKHKDKRKNNSSEDILPPPTGPQITDTNGAPPPDAENRLFTAAAEVNQVPVPATLALFGLGLVGMAWSRRKTV